MNGTREISIPTRFYDCASNDGQRQRREQYIVRSKVCCQDAPLFFFIIACNCLLLLLLPSDLGSVCNLGLGLLGSVADYLSVIVIFGTTSLLVELLLGFFLVFLALALTLFFGLLLLLGRGGLCFLRGRGFF